MHALRCVAHLPGMLLLFGLLCRKRVTYANQLPDIIDIAQASQGAMIFFFAPRAQELS